MTTLPFCNLSEFEWSVLVTRLSGEDIFQLHRTGNGYLSCILYKVVSALSFDCISSIHLGSLQLYSRLASLSVTGKSDAITDSNLANLLAHWRLWTLPITRTLRMLVWPIYLTHWRLQQQEHYGCWSDQSTSHIDVFDPSQQQEHYRCWSDQSTSHIDVFERLLSQVIKMPRLGSRLRSCALPPMSIRLDSGKLVCNLGQECQWNQVKARW
jgi:hypothetical protein